MEAVEVQPLNEVADLQARVKDLETRLENAETAREFLVAHAIAAGGSLRVQSNVFSTLGPLLPDVESKVWQNPVTGEVVFSTFRLGK